MRISDWSSDVCSSDLVDGQQRIMTIVRFHEDGLSLQGESKYAGKRFSELDEEIQNQFVSYTVSVDVIRNATRAEILQMFSRMNAYTLPLYQPEKRHSSFQGAFKWLINHLADEINEFFVK